MTQRFYYRPPAGLDPAKLGGLLIVIEGMDSSGRSTQISQLAPWLEQQGFAVTQVGLKRSDLVGPALEQAKQGNILSPRTMSLFYATDFYDQLENTIVPALRAGSIVLSDRYIYTLMARDLVRGADRAWLESLYSMSLVPNAVFFLNSTGRSLVQRTLQSRAALDYWESGMDLGLSRDWFDSYLIYLRRMGAEFKSLQQRYGFTLVNANRSVGAVFRELKTHISSILAGLVPVPTPGEERS